MNTTITHSLAYPAASYGACARYRIQQGFPIGIKTNPDTYCHSDLRQELSRTRRILNQDI